MSAARASLLVGVECIDPARVAGAVAHRIREGVVAAARRVGQHRERLRLVDDLAGAVRRVAAQEHARRVGRLVPGKLLLQPRAHALDVGVLLAPERVELRAGLLVQVGDGSLLREAGQYRVVLDLLAARCAS